MFWVHAPTIAFITLGLAIIGYVFRQKWPHSFTLSDGVNFLAIGIAIGSLNVAVDTYRQSITDSEEQQKSLNASRMQLQGVVDAMTKQLEIQSSNLEVSKAQQQVLDKSLQLLTAQQETQSKSLATAKAHLNLQEEREKRDKDREARRPIADVSLLLADRQIPLDEVSKRSEVEFHLERGEKWGRVTFYVKNTGDVEISKPLTVITTSPETVFVDGFDFMISERADHHAYTFPIGRDIEPMALGKIQYYYKAGIFVPDSVDRFDLTFSFHGTNLTRQQWKIHFKIIRES